MVGIAAAVAIVASIGLGVGAAWYKMQGLPLRRTAGAGGGRSRGYRGRECPEGARSHRRRGSGHQGQRSRCRSGRTRGSTGAGVSGVEGESRAECRDITSAAEESSVSRSRPRVQVAAAAAPVAVIEPVRELVAPPPPPPVVVTPAPAVASIEPQRPFFEPKDVNEQPAVANRVEPRLPDELKTRDISEVLVVRLLVSQTGHPSSISLLRRSKTGQSLDDAVVAAIKQWTFSPARKKGETVSCWMNLGVPVGRAN